MSQPYRVSVRDEVRRAVVNVAGPYHEATAVVLRRRIVVVVVLALGVAVLTVSMTRQPGQASFYWLTFALALVWAIGARVSGPVHLGGIRWRGRNQRPIISGMAIGVLLGGVFVLGGLLARQIPVVSDLITRVLQFTHQGTALVLLLALANAIGEEMFFRGALYTAVGRRYAVTISTLVYVGAILVSGNLMLGFAAALLGIVCAWERRSTGGVLAPMLTHFMWSLIVVLALPPLFGV